MALRMPIIAVVGRPNVGKSTFFNRVLKARKAIVDDQPGVTRDRLYAIIERFEFPFQLVDTAGLESAVDDELQKIVIRQTLAGLDEADLIIFLLDLQADVHPDDYHIVELLRKTGKPVVYAVNKCDTPEHEARAVGFYALGCPELQMISAMHGRGVDSLIKVALGRLSNYDSLVQSAQDRRAQEASQEQMVRHNMALEVKELGLDDVEEGVVENQEEVDFDSQGVEESDIEEEFYFAPVFVPESEDSNAEEYERKHRYVSHAGHALYSPDETLLVGEGKDGMGDIQGLDSSLAPADEDVEEAPPKLEVIKLAIVGRPNVGKSTLLNVFAGEERAVVSELAGTTRDALDIEITRDGQKYILIDTAGLRKQGKVTDKLEHYSVIRTLNSLSECDVALVVIDGVEGPTEQDAKIAGIAHEQGTGLVIVVNKWDLVEKDHKTARAYDQRIRDAFKFALYAPIVYTSAISGRRCPRVIEVAALVAEQRQRRIPSALLNRVLRSAIQHKALPVYRGRPVKLYFGAQVASAPPRFVIFVNYPKEIHFSYLRYLKNVLRQHFGFMGCNLKVVVKKR